MITVDYILPDFWLCALVNDEPFADDADQAAFDAFLSDGVKRYGRFWCLGTVDNSGNGFMRYHDAREYGVGSCDTYTVRFRVDRE